MAIPTGATAGYGYPDVTQYGARTHPAMAAAAAAAAGHFTAAGAYHNVGTGGGGGGVRDQCQVNGMLGLAGLGAASGPAGGQSQQHHPHQASGVVGSASGGVGGGGGNQHPVQQQQQQQQSNVPTYKWMQVKRNVPKPGKSHSVLSAAAAASCLPPCFFPPHKFQEDL